MLVRLIPVVKNYEWGSNTLMQDSLGIGSFSEPVAEVWFGTHTAGESLVVESGEKLSDLIGFKLSFLAKFLAADSPLSIQVHPNTNQALAGFKREQELGLEITDPARNYRDESHKPEILIALSRFRALCGFRPSSELANIFSAFSESDQRFSELAGLLKEPTSVQEIFTQLLEDQELAARFIETVGGAELSGPAQILAQQARDLAVELLSKYPADTGAMVALTLNYVELLPGEAVFLPAGNLHAYLSGLGVEVMAASDNVIRGGLTTKYIDKEELLRITDFTELPDPLVVPVKLAEGLFEYRVGAEEFKVYRAEVSGSNLLADLDLPAEALVLCESGEVAISTSLDEREVLKKGEGCYVSQAKKLSLTGSGTVFLVLGTRPGF